ncbi:DUF962-domain-containing protein [Clavulina sp. PMI_390]|nr:DUF962-domain-containing protein [Clavulina sp. PMI_390]
MTCVPMILWTAMVFFSFAPLPSAIVPYSFTRLTDYMAVETSMTLLLASGFQLYYFTLEPLGALIYLPQMVTMILTATSFAHSNPNAIPIAIGVHVACWIAQFIGHGKFEGRQPALFDSLVQALVLAPFFVHLEMLFPLGFKPALHKDVNNLSAIELTRVKKLEGEKRRAAEAKKAN